MIDNDDELTPEALEILQILYENGGAMALDDLYRKLEERGKAAFSSSGWLIDGRDV